MLVIFAMALAAGLCMFLYEPVSQMGVGFNAAAMFTVGMLIAGPDAALGGVTVTDVCERANVKGGDMTTASGIVNGLGSVGAILQASVVIYITSTWSWSVLFKVMGCVALVSAAILLPMLRR